MFCENEADSTSETCAGQFSIFGAVEEKSGREFGGFAGTARVEKQVAVAMNGAVFG